MVAGLVVLAGCGPAAAPVASTTPPTGESASATAVAPATARPATGQPGPAATPNGTDLAWLQLLIAMNERLVPVLELTPGRAGDPAVERRAAQARAARDAELVALRRLTHGVPLPAENPHAGHDMPGMTTAAQRATLTRSRGPDFDRRLADAVRAHLDQTIRLCTGEQSAGADPAFRHTAAEIQKAAEAERHRWT